MRRDDRLDVPLAKSPLSTSATLSPRIAASRAAPAPVIPPPTMRTSKTRRASSERVFARSCMDRREQGTGDEGKGRTPRAGMGNRELLASGMALGSGGRRVAIIAGVRTPFAKAGTALKDTSAIDLGKHCVAELLQRTELDGKEVDAVV